MGHHIKFIIMLLTIMISVHRQTDENDPDLMGEQ